LLTQYYGKKRNYPVVRRGTLAMMTDEEIDTLAGPQKLFIAELQSWPGNSGSPVFLSLGGVRGSVIIAGENFRFLGLVLGGYKNEFGASVVGEPGKMLEFGNELPIGVVSSCQHRDSAKCSILPQRKVEGVRRAGSRFYPESKYVQGPRFAEPSYGVGFFISNYRFFLLCPLALWARSAISYDMPAFGVGGNSFPLETVRSLPVCPPLGPINS
jgi:hypothetical protein